MANITVSLRVIRYPKTTLNRGVKEWRAKLSKANTSQESDEIHQFLLDPDVYVRFAAIRNPHAEESHIDKALKDEDELIRIAAANHKNAKLHHIEAALRDVSQSVRFAVGSKHLN